MSNAIPEGAIPKLFRQRNKSGTEIGAWYVNIKQKPVNLRTQDYMKARDRAREAFYNGVRTFSDDRYETLALPPISRDVETAAKVLNGNGHAKPSADWTVDLSDAAAAGIKPEVFPPGEEARTKTVLPQNPPETKTEPPKEPPKEGSTRISPEMINGIIKQGAAVLVELQIVGQEWMSRRFLKMEMGPVSPVHESRQVGAELWEQAIRELIPAEIPIPAWLLAPLAVAALTVPVQLQGAKAVPDPTEPVK